jgi:hypothetical protein
MSAFGEESRGSHLRACVQAHLVSEKVLAECYGVGREQIAALQSARRLVMHHDAEGRLTYVRYRRDAGIPRRTRKQDIAWGASRPRSNSRLRQLAGA